VGSFPDSPLYQFNEGNDQMNELPQDQTRYEVRYIDALQSSLHTCLATTCTASVNGRLWPTEKKIHFFPPAYFSFTLYPKPV